MRGTTGDSDLTDALRAAGVVGNDLLAVDWDLTPLGPPNLWPSSLNTVVRVVLGSRFAMWMAWGPELTFFCNDAYRRETLAGKYPWALGRPASEVWAEIWPEIGPRIDHVLSTGEATWDESLLLFLERSGYEEETYHTFSYSPLYDDGGMIVGILCVVAEETERVIGERRIATLRDLNSVSTAAVDEHEFLQASAWQLAGNPRSLPFVCMYTFDRDGRAVLNATTGVRPGEPVAPPVIALDARHQVWPASELARGESDWVLVDDLQDRFASVPSGAWATPPVRAVLVPLPGATGAKPVGFIVVGVNKHRPIDDVYRGLIGTIAQRLGAGVNNARAYAAERERAEQLAELDRAKTAFFSNVSHEFRTPLTLMLAPLADALHGEGLLESEQVDLVHRNGMRLLKLVNALLDFSKLEAGSLQARFVPADVSALTTELAGTFRDTCQRAGLSLEIDCEPSTHAYIDPDLWERVVLNLVSNAFKVTTSGGIRVQIRAAGDSLELSVADTGPGIPPEEQERIFERFHRVRGMQARSYEGTGIGLALVKEIVQLHHGTVEVRSVLGEGSEFVVRIPFGRAHLPAEHVSDQPPTDVTPGLVELFVQEALSWLPAGEHASQVPPVTTDATRTARRVLIADDNADLRHYLTRLLSPHWDVETVGDGLEALEVISQRRPDLLVTDVMMPGLDGFGLLRELRGDPETQDLPVIMLSARAGEEASLKGLAAGADDNLPKPFSGRELLARVRSHLELSLARRTAADDLRTQRAMLEQTLQQLPVGVLVAEAPSDEIVLANDQVGAMFARAGVTPQEIREHIWERLYLPDRKTLLGRPGLLTRAVRDGEVINEMELAYRTDDGRWRTIISGAAPILDEDGVARRGRGRARGRQRARDQPEADRRPARRDGDDRARRAARGDAHRARQAGGGDLPARRDRIDPACQRGPPASRRRFRAEPPGGLQPRDRRDPDRRGRRVVRHGRDAPRAGDRRRHLNRSAVGRLPRPGRRARVTVVLVDADLRHRRPAGRHLRDLSRPALDAVAQSQGGGRAARPHRGGCDRALPRRQAARAAAERAADQPAPAHAAGGSLAAGRGLVSLRRPLARGGRRLLRHVRARRRRLGARRRRRLRPWGAGRGRHGADAPQRLESCPHAREPERGAGQRQRGTRGTWLRPLLHRRLRTPAAERCGQRAHARDRRPSFADRAARRRQRGDPPRPRSPARGGRGPELPGRRAHARARRRAAALHRRADRAQPTGRCRSGTAQDRRRPEWRDRRGVASRDRAGGARAAATPAAR